MLNILRKTIAKKRRTRGKIGKPLRILRFFAIDLHSISRVIAPALATLFCFAPLFSQHQSSLASASALSQAQEQAPQDRYARLRAAMNRNDPMQAESILRGMLASNPETFALNNYDYLLARLLQERQAGVEAGAFFLRVANRRSPLAGYALWHLAELARSRGDYSEEQNLLGKFISRAGDNPLRERAIDRLADSYFKTGQYQNVIDTMRLLPRTRRDIQAMVGEAQLAMNRTNEARRTFEALLAGSSLDDASLRASAALDRIEASSGLGGKTLTEAEALRRARVYQFNRNFAEARKHYLTVINDFPESAKRAEALFQV
ncbi:MAG TPA: tetratricopeptide repeat protein, partial [Blastocatellia bacterium]|nr:tetratricopeptide repeat protein [Blastocatellia bacterium]